MESTAGKSTAWIKIAYVAFALCCALALAPVSFMLAALVVVLALAPLIVSGMRATRARLGEAPHAGMREFATLPYANPFAAEHGDKPLDVRISMAAEASAEFSRGASVLYLQTPPEVDADGVLSVLRAALRPTDHVEKIGGNEIVACLNLIRDLTNVESVIARLTQRLHERGWPQQIPPRFGRALYPMHGYSGADLIAAARAQVAAKAATPAAADASPPAPKPRRRKAAQAR